MGAYFEILSIPNKNYFDKKSFLPYVTFFKILIIGIVLVKIGTPYLNNEKENNQIKFTGVYEVTSLESPYQYLFFHKDQYLIFMEKSSENMTAFHYHISFDNQITLEDEQNRVLKQILIKNKDNSISFSFNNQTINAKTVQYKKMNVLQDRFHILVD